MSDDSSHERHGGLKSARLEEAARVSLEAGVLDTKWFQQPLDDGASVLACATSNGQLDLYAFRAADSDGSDDGHDVDGNRAQLDKMASAGGSDDALLLSLDWGGESTDEMKVGVGWRAPDSSQPPSNVGMARNTIGKLPGGSWRGCICHLPRSKHHFVQRCRRLFLLQGCHQGYRGACQCVFML